MAVKKSGLGKGLEALFVDNSTEELRAASAVRLKLMDIEPNRNQPRKSFDDESLAELADSIARHGILQPMLVRPLSNGGYQLIAGERRWRAARIAGLSEVPAVVREMTDEEAAALSLIENLQREDLNPLEEAQGLKTLMEKFLLTQEEVAERVGKSRPAIANAMRLLNLPPAVLLMVGEGSISAGHARALLSFETEEQMLETAEKIIKKGLSVREVERLARAASREKRESQKQRRDSFFDEVELALSGALCRRIKVTAGKNGTGTLEIEFNDKEDLSRIASALGDIEE
ncbi:MAG: ParB/RepB/Spo0J family partition protein [Clostridiales bacterium]|nr:ParB/RepB/Spo0J family partition protein [Clostridiales bacterium]